MTTQTMSGQTMPGGRARLGTDVVVPRSRGAERARAGVPAGSAVRTYRCVRLSLVALVALLLFSVWLERLTGAQMYRDLGSMSAYFYTPARSVFVGALVALGIGLVVISGRQGFEDTALNIAGMLAPIVAFVPTPRGLDSAPCVPDAPCTVPPEFVPSVVNNVYSLIVMGALGLVWGALTLCRRSATRSCRFGVGAAALVWALFVAWFIFGRESFLAGAHFTAAVPLFGLMIAVAWVNRLKASQRREGQPTKQAARSFGAVYLLVTVAMAFALAFGAAIAMVEKLAGTPGPTEWVLWVEVVLLVSFGVFWVAQTVDYWVDGVPEEAAVNSEGLVRSTG